MAPPKFEKRKKWENHNKDVSAVPLATYEPSSLQEVKEIVKKGYVEGIQIKASGSKHSWSNVCVTTGFLITPKKLNKVLSLDESILRTGVQKKYLVEVESGITISSLNKKLDKKGLALSNMGGYDGQTIAGATSTSTHGSGIDHGPLSDMIRSIDLVANGGNLFRIEPKNGITDKGSFKLKRPNDILIQDDNYFNAVKVGVGCMGVIYSMIIKVRSAFYLKEVRKMSKWQKVKKALIQGDVLKNNEHYEFLINPHKVGRSKDYDCLVTTRNTAPKPQKIKPKDKKRNFLAELGASSGLVTKVLLGNFNNQPKDSPKLISNGLKLLKDDSFLNKSFKVYNIGAANNIRSYSSEIALPMKNNKYIDGIEHMLLVIKKNMLKGGLYHGGPISFRFVKETDAFLSPMYKRKVCMIEILMMRDICGAKTMFESIEKALYKFDARVHWGQLNFLNSEEVKNKYPKLDEWKKVRKKLDPKGIFQMHFQTT